VVESKTRFELTHPEHAHFSLPAGCFEVIQQRDYATEEIRAVRD